MQKSRRSPPPELALPAGVALTSFGVLFAAEWGDASQIATAGLVARQGEAVAVALGAWTALVSVAAIAVGAGKLLVRRVPVRIVHRVAGGLFAVPAQQCNPWLMSSIFVY
jgi:putative Ca2+/H+ antiporter (TMEM165/GDT1 family)